jgi:hypothetical protein
MTIEIANPLLEIREAVRQAQQQNVSRNIHWDEIFALDFTELGAEQFRILLDSLNYLGVGKADWPEAAEKLPRAGLVEAAAIVSDAAAKPTPQRAGLMQTLLLDRTHSGSMIYPT